MLEDFFRYRRRPVHQPAIAASQQGAAAAAGELHYSIIITPRVMCACLLACLCVYDALQAQCLRGMIIMHYPHGVASWVVLAWLVVAWRHGDNDRFMRLSAPDWIRRCDAMDGWERNCSCITYFAYGWGKFLDVCGSWKLIEEKFVEFSCIECKEIILGKYHQNDHQCRNNDFAMQYNTSALSPSFLSCFFLSLYVCVSLTSYSSKSYSSSPTSCTSCTYPRLSFVLAVIETKLSFNYYLFWYANQKPLRAVFPRIRE